MKNYKVSISILLLMFSFSNISLIHQAFADEAEDAAMEMMEATGAVKATQQVMGILMQSILPLLKQANPDTSEDNLNVMAEELIVLLNEEAPNMVRASVPVYAKYLTVEDMKSITAFYKTPSGQKMVSLMPQIMQEASVVGQKHAEKALPKILIKLKQRMKERGISINA